MWFGDLVTMRWWDDLWLNESFATWASTLAQAEATRWHGAWTTFCHMEKASAYQQDQLPSTHPIAADIPDIAAVEVNFDGITYAKGASVLKQLVAYVGRDAFLSAVRSYYAAHAYGNATLADLLAALEQASGRDLGPWSRAGLATAGSTRCGPTLSGAATAGAPPSPCSRRPRPATRCCPRAASRCACRTLTEGAGLVRRPRAEGDIAGERPSSRSWPASGSPTWCC